MYTSNRPLSKKKLNWKPLKEVKVVRLSAGKIKGKKIHLKMDSVVGRTHEKLIP